MSNKILALARPEMVAMNAYVSARSIAANGHIWLDANENPWNDGQYHRYPEPQSNELVKRLAILYGVQSNQLLVTRGIDEGIDLLVRLFCRAGQDAIMICPPTYGMYQVAATIQGAAVMAVPLLKEQNFALNVTAVLEQWRPNVKIIFLCSPNNPTGNAFNIKDMLSICKKLDKKSIVIVDEAYVEFSTSNSLVTYLDDYPHLVVLRTFSKAYGLAGMRCGVTIAHPEMIQLLKKMIAPYPIPTPVVNKVLQQLNLNIMTQQVRRIIQERERLFDFLSQLSLVQKVWKSDANFLLFETPVVSRVMRACLHHGIVLRDRSCEAYLNNSIRVTIGDPTENTFLMEVLRRV